MPFRRSFRRERREWTGSVSVTPTTVAVNSQALSQILSAATMEEYPGAKVHLIQGSVFFSPATAPAAASGYGIFFGIYRRVTLGGQATPDPELNLDFPWVHWGLCFPQIGGTGAADSNASRWIGYFRFDILQRVRLRWHDFDDLFFTVKNSASSAASIQYSYGFRMQVLAGAK